jgi:steroid delta-isomerase-like uncharacterized protein
MMTREQMKEVAERHLAAEARHDADAAAATYGEDCFYENTAFGTRFRGRQGVALQYAANFAAIPDSEAVIEGEAYGENVIVHWGTFRGTVTGDFMGLPPTGRRIALPFAGVLFFKDGLMQGERIFFDLATLCEQAGYRLEQAQASIKALRAQLG